MPQSVSGILLLPSIQLEAAPACLSGIFSVRTAERSSTAVLEAARLLIRGDPAQTSVLDASAVFVQVCALLTDHDVAIRRDACRLLASMPLPRVPAQRLSQAVSKRPIKESIPGQRPSKVGRTAPLESRAGEQWNARGADGVLGAEDGGANDTPEEREGRVVEEASQGGLVVALEDVDVEVRRRALAALAAFGRQGVEAAGRGVASEGAAGNAARQLLRTVTSLLVEMSTLTLSLSLSLALTLALTLTLAPALTLSLALTLALTRWI